MLRALAKRIDKPAELQDTAARALKSPELIRLDEGTLPRFTTRDYRAAEDSLRQATNDLAIKTGFAVGQRQVGNAVPRSVRYQLVARMKNGWGPT